MKDASQFCERKCLFSSSGGCGERCVLIRQRCCLPSLVGLSCGAKNDSTIIGQTCNRSSDTPCGCPVHSRIGTRTGHPQGVSLLGQNGYILPIITFASKSSGPDMMGLLRKSRRTK